MWTYRAKITRIIDGDTLEVQPDLGFTVHVTVLVRLEGVWAVERSHPENERIVAAVQAWLDEHGDGSQWPIMLKTARLQNDAREVMTFTRYVARVTDRTGTACLNRHLSAWLAARGLTGGAGA